MPLPLLNEAQIAWVIEQVGGYIASQRRTYAPSAAPLSQVQRAAMSPFFPESTLYAARALVLTTARVANPPFYPELFRMGFEPRTLPNFEQMRAITFVDTIVSHGPFTPELLFHELVHVVQYQKLGVPDFAAKYVSGFLRGGSYERIPLEAHAYALGNRFEREPARTFSVEDEVQAWVKAGRY